MLDGPKIYFFFFKENMKKYIIGQKYIEYDLDKYPKKNINKILDLKPKQTKAEINI